MTSQSVTPKTASRRPKRPADAAYLERAALHYLERFATTKGHMAAVLRRKLRRRGLAEGVSEAEAEGWIADLIEKLIRLGYIDDAGFARARVQSLLARGKSVKAIRQALVAKSVPADLINDVLAEIPTSETETDRLAAIRYVRRRRIGPARLAGKAESPEEAYRRRQRELAAMARAGFAYDVARDILELEGLVELDEYEAGLQEI